MTNQTQERTPPLRLPGLSLSELGCEWSSSDRGPNAVVTVAATDPVIAACDDVLYHARVMRHSTEVVERVLAFVVLACVSAIRSGHRSPAMSGTHTAAIVRWLEQRQAYWMSQGDAPSLDLANGMTSLVFSVLSDAQSHADAPDKETPEVRYGHMKAFG